MRCLLVEGCRVAHIVVRCPIDPSSWPCGVSMKGAALGGTAKTAGGCATGCAGQSPRRGVPSGHARFPFRDQRLWAVVVMVLLVAVVHLLADLAQDRGVFPAPGFVWILLLLMPTVYAGTSFGLVGSLATAMSGVVAVLPELLLVAHTRTEAWGGWSAVAIVLVVAGLLGHRFEQERRLREAMFEAERERIMGVLDGQALTWRHLFDALPAGIVLVDASGAIRDVNAHLETLTRYRRDELVGSKVEVLVPRQLQARHLEQRGSLAGTSVDRPHGARPGLQLERQDGTEVPVDVALAQLQGTSLQIAMVYDDSARVEAERARALAERHFRLAFENNVAGMAISDLEGCILDLNRSYCTMLGRDAADVLGHDLLELTHPDDRATTAELHRRLIAGEIEHAQYTKRYLRSDGQVVLASLLTGIVRDESGAPLFLVASVRDITEERALADRLSYRIRHDPLTGLPNRMLLEECLTQVATAQATQACALVLLDLDDFKEVNDTLGYDIGDQLLVELAGRLSRAARPGDMLCRPGGDEFLYLAERISSPAEADEIVERLLAVLAEPFALGGVSLEQGASAGIVIVDAIRRDGASPLQEADAALYEAKRRGKGQSVTFAPEMRERVSSSFALVQDLRRALPLDELSLHYQPIVNLAARQVVGFEALMRWHQPTRGAVRPDVFIPLAERSGLITGIGRFALEEATAAATRWPSAQANTPAPYVSVNLSARQFHDPGLLSTVERVLKSTLLPSSRLVLEITESAALTDVTRASMVVKELRRFGVALALDDFGTGYSSLSYLAQLQPDIIKIDRSFVSPETECGDAESLLSAIVSLGHELEMTVVAEGVETDEQLERLRRMGCDLGQGYLFSRPVPVGEVEAILQRSGSTDFTRQPDLVAGVLLSASQGGHRADAEVGHRR